MPTVTTVKRRRLVNAGRRRRHNAKRRHLTPKQIRFFGSKRQRAALKNRSRRKHSARRNRGGISSVSRKAFRRGGEGTRSSRYHYKAQSHARRRTMREESGMPVRRNRSRRRRRKHNVRSIVTVYPMHMNAGRRKNVAARRRHRRHNARRHRRHNVVYQRRLSRGRYAYTSNVGRRRRRRHNVHHRRRHNQGRVRRAGAALGGTATKVLSIIGGATVTKLISDLLPPTFQTGVLGYLGVGVVAVAQGQILGRMMRSSAMTENLTAGGLVYLTIKILNDFVPSIAGTLGLRGMGLIAPTQGFAVPLVNQGGSMGMFVRPGFVPAPYVPAATGALGSLQSIRRGGRVR